MHAGMQPYSYHRHRSVNYLCEAVQGCNMAQQPCTVESGEERMNTICEALEDAGIPAFKAAAYKTHGVPFKDNINATVVRDIQSDHRIQDFQVLSAGDSVFGEHSGASSMTARVAKRQLSTSEAILEMDEEGLLVPALNAFYERFGDKDAAIYHFQALLFQFSRGWDVEKALARTDEFKKVSESQDIGGQDFYHVETGEYVQVKSATHGFKGYHDEGTTGNHYVDGVKVLYYQIDDKGNVFTDFNHTVANAEAAESAGMKKTAIWRDRLWA